MKLVRYGAPGAEKPGALDANGVLRDLSAIVADIDALWISPGALRQLRAVDLAGLRAVPGQPRLGPPIANIRQFIGIGLNYRRHAQESNMALPTEPPVFHKAITSICGADDPIVLPPGSETGDWEIELGVVIGSTTRRVSEADALDAVAGYCLANDVSDRDWQLQRGGQWSKGKSFDTFGPIGPWLVTADEIPDPQRINMELHVNGVLRQSSNTADMVFTVAYIVSHLSQFMTLLPGDVIVTGTPEGVAFGMNPPPYLKRGDVITMTMTGLGTQTHQVV